MSSLRIASARPIRDGVLAMSLTDGSIVERDLSMVLQGGVLEPLRDPNTFGEYVSRGERSFGPETSIFAPTP